MRAVVRHLEKPDAPEDRGSFIVLVRATLGPSDGPGEESFDFDVCTPRWLEENRAEKGFLWPRHHLIVWAWDWNVISRAIHDVCVQHEGSTWTEVAEKIARYGSWEFEDYTP